MDGIKPDSASRVLIRKASYKYKISSFFSYSNRSIEAHILNTFMD
jgi:hypothetical protein